ncbi:MAG: GxxExxY protein [Candidatus Spyradenecus sp.]
MTEEEVRHLSDQVRDIAFQVHLRFAPGYLESVYENALAHRLEQAGLAVKRQHPITVRDVDGFVVGEFVADLFVEEALIVELKAVKNLTEAHLAQLLNYLYATGIRDGLLVNFGSHKFQCTKQRI